LRLAAIGNQAEIDLLRIEVGVPLIGRLVHLSADPVTATALTFAMGHVNVRALDCLRQRQLGTGARVH
jgi:hypothetical protein